MRGEYIKQDKAGMKKCYVCLLWRRDAHIKKVVVREYDLNLNLIENELYRCTWDCPGYSVLEMKLRRGEGQNF